MSDAEASIVKEFRNLYDYVCNLGRCINQIHSRLENIEKVINEMSLNHANFVKRNSEEITDIRSNMVNKDEFSDFIEKMKVSIGEILPPLPALTEDTLQVQRDSQETLNQSQETLNK